MISIIVPAYNVEKTIRGTMFDILKQTYDDYEVVIVDDGSTDTTPAICDEFATTSEKVRVIHQENGGLSNARNNGTKTAIGDYVTYVDSDDRLSENFLKTLSDALISTGADISSGRIERVKEGSVPRAVGTKVVVTEVYNKKQAISEMLTGKKIWVGACCRLIPRQWMLEEPFFEGKYYEDLSNTYRVNLKAEKIAFVDVPLYYYVMHGGSITSRSQTTTKQCQDYYDAIHLCAKGCLTAFPNLKKDIAVLIARDSMSLYLHIRRCEERDDALERIANQIVRWMKKNWKVAAGNGKAPRNVRLRTAFFRISPWLYEKIYYIGIRFTGKKIS